MKKKVNEQILEILEIVQCIAAEDYSMKAKVYGENDLIDALAMGVNMLGEEIEAIDKEKENKKQDLEKLLNEVKDTRNKIFEENEKFRSLTENINIGIYSSSDGAESELIEVNPAMASSAFMN